MELFQLETTDGSLILVETVEESPWFEEAEEVEQAIRKKAGTSKDKPLVIAVDKFEVDSETEETRHVSPEEETRLVGFRVRECPHAVHREGDGPKHYRYEWGKNDKISEGDEFRMSVLPHLQFTLLRKGEIVCQKSIEEL